MKSPTECSVVLTSVSDQATNASEQSSDSLYRLQNLKAGHSLHSSVANTLISLRMFFSEWTNFWSLFIGDLLPYRLKVSLMSFWSCALESAMNGSPIPLDGERRKMTSSASSSPSGSRV